MRNRVLQRDGLHFFFPGVFLNFMDISDWHRILLSVSSQNRLQHFENNINFSLLFLTYFTRGYTVFL